MSKRQRNNSLLSLSGKDPKRLHISGTTNNENMDAEEISFVAGLGNESVLNSTENMNAAHKNRIKELDEAMATLSACEEPTLKDMANAMFRSCLHKKPLWKSHTRLKNNYSPLPKKPWRTP